MARAPRSRCGRIVERASLCIAAAAVIAAVSAASATAAHASDTRTAEAVVTAQILELRQENALNKCLAASPTKNTPCITRQALALAKLADREITTISSALDGTERDCVRTVAVQEIAALKLLKAAGNALYANQRKKARGLFIKSLAISDQEKQIQPGCFSLVLGGNGG
jgi:hypothetical protein